MLGVKYQLSKVAINPALACENERKMSGTKSNSGRKKAPGKIYRLSIRFVPGRHAPELAELLELLTTAPPPRRADILNDLAAGGDLSAARAAVAPEAIETEMLLSDLFGDYL